MFTLVRARVAIKAASVCLATTATTTRSFGSSRRLPAFISRTKTIGDGARFGLRVKATTKLLTPSLVSKCSIHTTPARYNPIVSTILRQVIKVVAIFTGRAIRNWWKQLPNNKRRAFLAWLAKHKWKFLVPLAAALVAAIAYYQTHIERTPITGRERFIAFTHDQFALLNKIELDSQLATFKSKLLPTNHPITRRVAKVAKQLLDRNSDIDTIKQHEWSVSVIDDSSTMNAFVLATGNIFVFSGLLHICENDDQLGVVLSHEMSHAILQHSVEMASHAHIVDLFFIGIIGFVWMLLPTDIVAIAGTALSRFLLSIIFDTPYSKMLETEADEVGLELAAKACFDVREAAAFWKKMEIIEHAKDLDYGGAKGLSVDLDFLRSHPSHESRWEHINSIMDRAIECRKAGGCGPLPRDDPREKIEILKNSLMADLKKEKYEGVLRLNELK